VDLDWTTSPMPAIAKVFADANAGLTITSVTDGRHSNGSLHYVGKAIDIRSRHLSLEKRQEILGRLKRALGPSFDCLIESSHFHIELDP